MLRGVGDLVRSGDPDSYDRVIALARNATLAPEDVAEIASALADSGARLQRESHRATFASTGGPTSLTTLLCPLLLHGLGFQVAVLGVPGRPAGAVDVLSLVSGYRTSLTPPEAEQALASHGCVHLLAGDDWAPADAGFFSYRQTVGAQEVRDLVIASIVSKALAMGAIHLGLEVRISPFGNFGESMTTGREAALRFNQIARLTGLKPICFVTDGSHPYQPYVGRGEALVALALTGAEEEGEWLADHVSLCRQIANAFAPRVAGPERQLKVRIREQLTKLLWAHATFIERFDEHVASLRDVTRFQRFAVKPGYVRYDLRILRDVLTHQQRLDIGSSAFADPAGVILQQRSGSYVNEGDGLLAIRTPPSADQLIEGLAATVSISNEPSSREKPMEIIDA